MKSLGYSILALILSYLFLLIQFPYEEIKENMIRDFADLNMGKVRIGKVSPSFPLDLYMRDVSWEFENMGIQIPDLILGINILNTLFGKTNIEIKDWQNPPRLRINYYYSGKEGNLKMRLDNTELRAAYKNDFSFSFKLSGEAKLQWLGENYEKLNGEFWVLLEKEKIEFKEGESLPFFLQAYDRLKAEVQIRDGDIRAKRLVISGKESKEIVWRDLSITQLFKEPTPAISALLGMTPIDTKKY